MPLLYERVRTRSRWPDAARACDGVGYAGILAHLQEQRVEMGGLLLGTVHDGLTGGDGLAVEITSFARSIAINGTIISHAPSLARMLYC